MRRLATIAGALLAVGAGATATGVAPALAKSNRSPRAQLTGFACHSTLDPAARTVSVTSVMRPVTSTRSLQVRLTLLERGPGESSARSVGHRGDLGVWLSPSDRTLGRRSGDVWKLKKSVYGVDAPASYKFRVDYRWRGADGRVLTRATRQTRLCGERELRPDPAVTNVAVVPIAGHAGRDHYVATIANRGATATGAFSVRFQPGSGAPAVSRAVASLRAGQRVRLTFSGPTCDATSPPAIAVDPLDEVDDFNRANNALTVACPGSAAARRPAGAE